MLETEIKAMLDKSQYDTIFHMFSYSSSVTQTNSYYIAPSNELKKHGITFRVRTIDGKHTLQIKQHKSKKGALQVSEETEFSLTSVPSDFTAEEVSEYTGIKTPVTLIGELTTHRLSCFYKDGVEICLDKSTYLGKTDYEIEIEYTSAIPDELLKKLSLCGVNFDLPTQGKYSRFLNILMQ